MTDFKKFPAAMSAEEHDKMVERMAAFWKKTLEDPKNQAFKKDLEEAFGGFAVIKFDRKLSPESGLTFEIDPEYASGKIEKAENFIKSQGHTREMIVAKCLKVAEIIRKEPGGEAVSAILIVNSDPDGHYIHLRKPSNALVLTYSALMDENFELLEMLLVPHEVYHALFEIGDMAIEEILVHALSFARAASVYRQEKTGARPAVLFKNAMAQLSRILSEEKGSRNGKMTQRKAINKIIALMEAKEMDFGRFLSFEELLEISIPVSLDLLKDNNEILVKVVANGLAGQSDAAATEGAKKLWQAQSKRLLSSL